MPTPARDPKPTIEWVLKCHAQSISFMRQSQGALRLLRVRQVREKREADDARLNWHANWTEHCAANLMAQVLPNAQPAAQTAPPPPPAPLTQAEPDPPPDDEPKFDPTAAAEEYAMLYPNRAALIRQHGGLPDNITFGPTGTARCPRPAPSAPALLALDRECAERNSPPLAQRRTRRQNCGQAPRRIPTPPIHPSTSPESTATTQRTHESSAQNRTQHAALPYAARRRRPTTSSHQSIHRLSPRWGDHAPPASAPIVTPPAHAPPSGHQQRGPPQRHPQPRYQCDRHTQRHRHAQMQHQQRQPDPGMRPRLLAMTAADASPPIRRSTRNEKLVNATEHTAAIPVNSGYALGWRCHAAPPPARPSPLAPAIRTHRRRTAAPRHQPRVPSSVSPTAIPRSPPHSAGLR